MKFRSVIAFFLFALQMAVIGGCGSDSTTSVPRSTLVASQTCITCHSGTNASAPSISPVTGRINAADWMLSPHNSASAANKSGSGAGCPDCHGPSHNHPNDYCGQCHGGAGAPTQAWLNPDSAGQCWNCHRTDLPKKSPAHFYNITGASVHPAMYATPARQKACTRCHDPHIITPTPQMSEWADSAHGKVTGVAWANEDFKNAVSGGSYQCIRCHTATGFKNFLVGNWANPFPTTTWATAADGNGREVLTCDACHANFDFRNSYRRPPAFTAPYNKGLNPATFPDAGASNLCIACHSGRESGETITALADADMNNVSFKNSHYLAAAGLMYVKEGFTAFADPAAASGTIGTLNGVNNQSLTYGQSLTSNEDGGALTSTHRKLGTAAMATDSHVGGRGLVEGGPCVTCHMSGGHHTLKMDAYAYNGTCINCHTKEGTTPLTAENFVDVFIDEQAVPFKNALNLATNILLSRYNIEFDTAHYPYFFEKGTNHSVSSNAVKNWTRSNDATALSGTLSGADAKKLMGACFNINILTRDPAAYVHARTYARRLLYDTVDFLDNTLMDRSVSFTAVATDPVNFINGGTSATSSSSFNYLVKFNGTAGALDITKERP
jgi:hypothetical protein